MSRGTGPAGVAVAIALLLGGCSSSQELGGGPEIDLCGGYAELETFEEPSITDPEAVRRWVIGSRRVVERVDLDREIDETPVPNDVARALDAVDTALGRFQSAIADDRETLVGPAEDFAADADFTDAYGVLTTFVGDHCG